MTPLLDVRQLDVCFRGGVHAVRGVGFKVYPGEILGLIGESGSGKSATANALLGLNQESIEHQVFDVLYKNTPLSPVSVRGKEIGMVFQNPMSALNPTMTIGSQIIEGMRLHMDWKYEVCRSETLSLLHQVGLSDPAMRFCSYPHELSGGMLQRVVIAIAVASRPSLLIADEPTTALDVTIQAQILKLLQQLQQEHKMALLLLSHDIGVIAQVCGRVVVMLEGEIVECQSVRDLFLNPIHPYTKSLLDAVEGRC